MPQSCVRSFRENYVQSYHLVRRLKKVMCKIYPCCVKNYPIINSWFEKLCIKKYKYHKSYAEKNHFSSYIEKNIT